MEGRGPSQIARQLKEDKVLTPTSYHKRQGRNTTHTEPENPYGWHSSTVVGILERREYTGCVVNFKTYTNSIWDKKQRDNPIENQAIFPDSHERIIEDEIFEKVQQIRQQRHRKTKSGRSSMFSGLVYCSDCGEKLYYGATNNYRTEGAFFDCSLHWKHKDKCGTHYIREKVFAADWFFSTSRWSPGISTAMKLISVRQWRRLTPCRERETDRGEPQGTGTQ